jgi:hypothetical protein
MTDHSRSLTYVREVIAELPRALAQTLEVQLPALSSAPRSVVTTGIGASEGPARVLAAVLTEGGIAARFTPLSHFTTTPLPGADLLVLFSQGLSPNARLVLDSQPYFPLRWLVTSLDPKSAKQAAGELLALFTSRGFSPIVVPPATESGTLVRLSGPTVATLMALRLGALLLADRRLLSRTAQAPDAYRAARDAEPLGDGPLALVTIGTSLAYTNGHRWKLLEALLAGDPPVWDVLQFAHGPLQAFYDKPLTLLVLERGRGSPLLARLANTLQPALHRLIHLGSEHDDELSFFEHAAAIDALLLATLERAPRDLFDWPGRNRDAPLYGLGGTST